MQRRIELAQISPAGDEPEQVNAVGARGVSPHDFPGIESRCLRYSIQVDAVILHRNDVLAIVRSSDFLISVLAAKRDQIRRHFLIIRVERIVEHCQGEIRGYDVLYMRHARTREKMRDGVDAPQQIR